MSSSLRLWLVGALLVAGLSQSAHAQVVTAVPSLQQRNEALRIQQLYIRPGLKYGEYLAGVNRAAQVAQQIPPYLLGYNPYPAPIISTGTVIPNTNQFPTPFLGGGLGTPFSPGFSNPYAAGGAGQSNSYSTDPYGSGYSNPYSMTPNYGGSGPAGENQTYARGVASIYDSFGKLINQQEDARAARERAIQARLETAKQRFALEAWMRENTPSFTETQKHIAKLRLTRIQSNATPGEINSGNALTELVGDLAKYAKKIPNDLQPLPENVLAGLNVTTSNASLGVLRNGADQLVWPSSLEDIVGRAEQKAIQEKLNAVVKGAAKGNPDLNTLKDVRTKMDTVRQELRTRINDIPPGEYLAANRFLNDLDLARTALERNEARHQFEFDKFVKSGPKTAKEVVEWMTAHGLKFGPATSQDEASYRALHQQLANIDVQVNGEFALANPDE